MQRLRAFLRWILSGYDWPLYRDWLAWSGLLMTTAWMTVQVERVGAVVLWSAPVTFAFCGWVLGAVRNLWRGYREGETRSV